jgi:hypothetical protein
MFPGWKWAIRDGKLSRNCFKLAFMLIRQVFVASLILLSTLLFTASFHCWGNSISRIISFPRVVKVMRTIRFSWGRLHKNARIPPHFLRLDITAFMFFTIFPHLIFKPFPFFISNRISCVFLWLPPSTSFLWRIQRGLLRFLFVLLPGFFLVFVGVSSGSVVSFVPHKTSARS